MAQHACCIVQIHLSLWTQVLRHGTSLAVDVQRAAADVIVHAHWLHEWQARVCHPNAAFICSKTSRHTSEALAARWTAALPGTHASTFSRGAECQLCWAPRTSSGSAAGTRMCSNEWQQPSRPLLCRYIIPGGSAGIFTRGDFKFDVGSSMMFGMGQQGTTNLITKALQAVGKQLETVPDPTQIHYHLPKSDAHPQVQSGAPLC